MGFAQRMLEKFLSAIVDARTIRLYREGHLTEMQAFNILRKNGYSKDFVNKLLKEM